MYDKYTLLVRISAGDLESKSVPVDRATHIDLVYCSYGVELRYTAV